MFRDVSGRRNTIIDKHAPETMDRNQNIQVQPAAKVRTPPSIGPILGAIVILMNVSSKFFSFHIKTYAKDNALMKEPLSAGDAISVTTP